MWDCCDPETSWCKFREWLGILGLRSTYRRSSEFSTAISLSTSLRHGTFSQSISGLTPASNHEPNRLPTSAGRVTDPGRASPCIHYRSRVRCLRCRVSYRFYVLLNVFEGQLVKRSVRFWHVGSKVDDTRIARLRAQSRLDYIRVRTAIRILSGISVCVASDSPLLSLGVSLSPLLSFFQLYSWFLWISFRC